MPALNDVVSATGFGVDGASKYWPVILAALRAEEIDSEAVQVAAAATLRTELGPYFAPVTERSPSGADPYTHFEAQYGASTSVGKRLGNYLPGDGYKFRGRGFIQLTGRSNYTNYGRRIGVDLVGNPDAALRPYEAARIFAAYFKDRGVYTAANSGDWVAVRKLVNGGLNGWETFKAVIAKLTAAPDTILPKPKGIDTSVIAVLVGGGLLALLVKNVDRW